MTLKARILVVDDEPGILRFLRAALVANDFEFESARSVQEALKSIASNAPDVVVLDLGLPDGDGKDVIRQVREWLAVPIIVISARDREAEKIAALDLGADDFIAKPFRVGELMARIRVALRNQVRRRSELPAVRIADVEIDHVRHRVKRAGKEIRLTPKEFELLAFSPKMQAPWCLMGKFSRQSGEPTMRRTSHIFVSTSVAYATKSKTIPTTRKSCLPSQE
jgi:two-component system, OmpR family, KDP operon response regulator KdpE